MCSKKIDGRPNWGVFLEIVSKGFTVVSFVKHTKFSKNENTSLTVGAMEAQFFFVRNIILKYIFTRWHEFHT